MFHVNEHVYEPAEDSFLFAENLKVEEGSRVIDMGAGCGILSILAAEKASCVVAVDINPYAIRCAKENAKLNNVNDRIFFIQSDLFNAIKRNVQFDLILFNAPYLPEDSSEVCDWVERAWFGGFDGRAIIDRFLESFPSYLAENGRVLLMQSTLSDVKKTFDFLDKQGFKAKIAAKKDLPLFETIVLIEIWI
ncbi:methyltransferase [Candidatus Bathyarchaeota archaeon]|nr:methyltransferase [Candidatus Bathyarchaeota archaeon]